MPQKNTVGGFWRKAREDRYDGGWKKEVAPEIKGMMEPYFKKLDYIKIKGIITKAGSRFAQVGTITRPGGRTSKVCIPFVM